MIVTICRNTFYSFERMKPVLHLFHCEIKWVIVRHETSSSRLAQPPAHNSYGCKMQGSNPATALSNTVVIRRWLGHQGVQFEPFFLLLSWSIFSMPGLGLEPRLLQFAFEASLRLYQLPTLISLRVKILTSNVFSVVGHRRPPFRSYRFIST